MGAIQAMGRPAALALALAVSACYEDPPGEGAHPCAACLPCETCVEGAEGPACQADSHASRACVGSIIHWLDSCGVDEGAAEACPEHATCENLGTIDATCVCTNHWEGDGCCVCPGNWDPDEDCNACVGGHDPATNCEACLPNWSIASGCTACIGNWDLAQECLACEAHWEDFSNNCGTCPANWDEDQNCDACLNHWVDEGNDCGTCAEGWDAAQDCAACLGNWDEATDCTTCSNHWIDEDNGCGTCAAGWDAAQDCAACLGNWDEATDCATCSNHWIDEDNGCGTCPAGYLAADDCAQVCGNSNREPEEACDDGNVVEWDGCNACAAAEFQVNTETGDEQSDPAVAVLPGGGFVVVWTSYLQDGSSYGVYGQRYAADGSRSGAEFLVNTTVANSQIQPAVSADADGDLLVAWSSLVEGSGEFRIFAQRYDSAGARAGAEFEVCPDVTGEQSLPAVAMFGDGRAVATWTTATDIYAVLLDSDGAGFVPGFQVNTADSGSQSDSAVAVLGDAAFVVVWTNASTLEGAYGVRGQRFDAIGAPLGAEFGVNTTSTYSRRSPSIATGGGHYVVSWSSYLGDGSGDGVFARLFAADGGVETGEFQANTYETGNQSSSSAAAAGDGGFVIVWGSEAQDGDGWGAFGQRFGADGAAAGAEFPINAFTTGSQIYPIARATAEGQQVIVWQSYDQDGSGYGVFAQRYDSEGTPLGIATSF